MPYTPNGFVCYVVCEITLADRQSLDVVLQLSDWKKASKHVRRKTAGTITRKLYFDHGKAL
jgi:hypothetical protein